MAAAATTLVPAPRQMTIAAGEDFHEKPVNQNADELRLVSLGCYCGPKLSIRALGRDAETLPFDWVRTRIDGLLHFMKNDFDGFFHYDTKQVVPGAGTPGKPMVTHRSFYHSFWHDDLADDATEAKYRRRMARFHAIDAHSKPVLFVRSVVSSDEFQHTDRLYHELQERFGRCSKLLVLIDFQTEDKAVLVNGYENLLVAKLHHRAHMADNGGAPYVKAISMGIEWAKGRKPPEATVSPSISMVQLSPIDWGLKGLGGLDAFERIPSEGMVALSLAEPPATVAAPVAAGIPQQVPAIAQSLAVAIALPATVRPMQAPLRQLGASAANRPARVLSVSAPGSAMPALGALQQGSFQTSSTLGVPTRVGMPVVGTTRLAQPAGLPGRPIAAAPWGTLSFQPLRVPVNR